MRWHYGGTYLIQVPCTLQAHYIRMAKTHYKHVGGTIRYRLCSLVYKKCAWFIYTICTHHAHTMHIPCKSILTCACTTYWLSLILILRYTSKILREFHKCAKISLCQFAEILSNCLLQKLITGIIKGIFTQRGMLPLKDTVHISLFRYCKS